MYDKLKNPKDVFDFDQIVGKIVLTYQYGTHGAVELWDRDSFPKIYDSKEEAEKDSPEEWLKSTVVSDNWPKIK